MIILYYIILYYIILYYIMLCYVILYYIILYYITLSSWFLHTVNKHIVLVLSKLRFKVLTGNKAVDEME